MKTNTTDKINGIGVLLRFITPILVTLILYILTLIRQDLDKLKQHFENHLSEHKKTEVILERRLTRIETLLNEK